MKQGRFKQIFPNGVKNVQREKFFNSSKFDFKIDDKFLEIKTPLHFLSMKIPKNIRDKRISEISNMYDNALNDI